MAAKTSLGQEKDPRAIELGDVSPQVLITSPPVLPGSEDSHITTQESDEKSGQSSNDNADAAEDELQGVRLMLLLLCLFIGCFTSGYDSSCLGTLIPVITDEFNSLKDIGWFQTAYLLGVCAPLLIYGRLYTIYSMKTLYLSSQCIFIVGSIITTTSPNAPTFILGRALTGLGGAGLNSGCSIILSRSTPLNRRPTYYACLGAVECASLAFSPLVAGSIARYTTWRVCFAIVIPFALIDGLVMSFGIGSLRQPERAQLDWKKKMGIIDWAGLGIQVPMTVCLILALQWAGTQYSWDNWRIILLLVITGVLAIVFFFTEHNIGENAMLPLRMLRQRTVACAAIVEFCNLSALWVAPFYLPVYFQAIRNATTLGSGLMILPFGISQATAALIGGPITTYIGYYNPNLMAGGVLSVIGTGLLTTLRPDSSAAKWVSFQIIYGLGIGMAFQPPFLAVQTVVERASIPIALVLLSFAQISGGIIALAMAQTVFLNTLAHNLVARVPQVDPSLILNHGALGLIKVVPVQYRAQVLSAYNEAIVDVLYIPLAFTCLALLFSFGIEWKSVKKREEMEGTVEEIEETRAE